MPTNRNVLFEVRRKLDLLVAELTGQGADRAYVLYIIEREIAELRREAPHEGVDITEADRSNGEEWATRRRRG